MAAGSFPAARPDDFFLVLLKGEGGFYHQVELGEIEVKFLAFVEENVQQQPPIQRHEIDLRPAASDVEYTVMELSPFFFTCQTVGGQPDPWSSETRPQFLSA